VETLNRLMTEKQALIEETRTLGRTEQTPGGGALVPPNSRE